MSMTTLNEKFADISRVGHIDKFIYFSECNSSHGPRIKFYGGSERTERTKDAPTFAFSPEGAADSPLLQPWMNKQNCPNAFDNDKIKSIKNFINNNLPILLLVWYNHLNQSYALKYFEGSFSFEDLLDEVRSKEDIMDIMDCETMEDLDIYCRQHELYWF